MSRRIGYARASAFDDAGRLEEQVQALEGAGCKHIVTEAVASIADPQPELERLIDQLDIGDVLVTVSLDRIVPTLFRLERLVAQLRHPGASLLVLDIDLATDTPAGRAALKTFRQAADFEKRVLSERQREGVLKAQAAGKVVGQTPTATRQAPEILRLHGEGKSNAEISRVLGISRASIARVVAHPELALRIAAGEPGASWNELKAGLSNNVD